VAIDPQVLAQELIAARSTGQTIPIPPSARDGHFDLTAAYAVEAELVRARTAGGSRTVGYKVGYASKALWRMLGLDTLVWAHMYDDTVRYASSGSATLSVDRLRSAKIEPEIVFTLKTPLGETADATAVLESVESFALGFEIIDCPFPDWKYQPSDFVAAFGLHAALVVGQPRTIDAERIPTLVEELSRFKVKLLKDGQLVAEGSGRNVLRSPALCLGELAAAMSRRSPNASLAAGDVVSSGTLTESQPISAEETWTVTVDGLELPDLTLRLEA